MNNVTNKKNTGSGFTLGVALGALIGTGAMILAKTSDGKKIVGSVKEHFEKAAHTFREKYPQESQEVVNILHQALSEAQKATNEIKDLSQQATRVARQKTEDMHDALITAQKQPIKRTFSRSGKPLPPANLSS